MSFESGNGEGLVTSAAWYMYTDSEPSPSSPLTAPTVGHQINGHDLAASPGPGPGPGQSPDSSPSPSPAQGSGPATTLLINVASLALDEEDEVYDLDDNFDYPFDDHERNLNIAGFFKYWMNCSASPRIKDKVSYIAGDLIATHRQTWVTREAMEKREGTHSEQGIPWDALETTPAIAKDLRRLLYNNFVSISLSREVTAAKLLKVEHFYRFNRYIGLAKPRLTHFQLRHLIGATDNSHVYYGGPSSIVCNNLTWEPPIPFIKIPIEGSKVWTHYRKQFTSVAAANGVVVGGGYLGEYAYKAEGVDRDEYYWKEGPTNHHEGLVVDSSVVDGIINQVQLYTPRSTSNPSAVFCTNNDLVKVLDCNTNRFIKTHKYDFSINGCATSPDQKLRVLVGDDPSPMVTEVESGQIVTRLDGHDDHCFASAWADDGVTFATGSQDMTVRIWDARKWNQSVHFIKTEMAAPRSLTFSRLGSGRRHLIIAEAADRVHVVDAFDYRMEHSIDMFGEIGGLATSPDGSKMFVAITDENFGGVMVYDRHDLGRRPRLADYEDSDAPFSLAHIDRFDSSKELPVDWLEQGDSWDYGGIPRRYQLDPRRFEVDEGQKEIAWWLL